MFSQLTYKLIQRPPVHASTHMKVLPRLSTGAFSTESISLRKRRLIVVRSLLPNLTRMYCVWATQIDFEPQNKKNKTIFSKVMTDRQI
jgi:hypothetical protein